MKKLSVYLSAGCISFTFSCIFYLFFSVMKIFPPFEEKTLIGILFTSISITALISISHIVTIRNQFFLRVSEITIVLLILLIAGKSFGMYPFTSFYISAVVAIGLLTYGVVIVAIFIGDQASAKKINSAIQKQNSEENR